MRRETAEGGLSRSDNTLKGKGWKGKGKEQGLVVSKALKDEREILSPTGALPIQREMQKRVKVKTRGREMLMGEANPWKRGI